MTALAVSSRVRALPRSGIRGIMELAVERPGAIRLEVGDPDFATPDHIVDAAARAARDGWTHYAPSAGLPELRRLTAEKVSAVNGIACVPEQVVVTTGASGGLYAALLALLDGGDEALVPDPGWPNYRSLVLAAGAAPVPYPLDRRAGFVPDVDALERAVGPRTRVLVVNSPGNPTGTVHSRSTVEALVELAQRRGLWLVSDECYDELVFDGEHVSPASVAVNGIVSVFSFSKTYAMTGWRVGYVVCPREVAPLVANAQEGVVSCVSTVGQKAAEAALAGSQEPSRRMAAAYRRRRDAALVELEGGGPGYVTPAGAFYLMVDVPGSSETFARALLAERGVAVTPGAAFGAGGEGMVRVSLAASDDAVVAGVRRLREATAGAAP